MTDYEDEMIEIVQGSLGDWGVSPCPQCKFNPRIEANRLMNEIITQLQALKHTAELSQESEWVKDEFGREYRFIVGRQYKNGDTV